MVALLSRHNSCPGELWTLLRPSSIATIGKCSLIGEQHDGSNARAFLQLHLFSHRSGGAGISIRSYCPTCGGETQLCDDESEHSEPLFSAGEPGGGTATFSD